MDKNTDILNRLNHKDGMTVPEGFFDDFAQRMEAALPERPELSTPSPYIPRTTWQRIRPYVYWPPCLPVCGACSKCSLSWAEATVSHWNLIR